MQSTEPPYITKYKDSLFPTELDRFLEVEKYLPNVLAHIISEYSLTRFSNGCFLYVDERDIDGTGSLDVYLNVNLSQLYQRQWYRNRILVNVVEYHYSSCGYLLYEKWTDGSVFHRLDGPAVITYSEDGTFRDQIWYERGIQTRWCGGPSRIRNYSYFREWTDSKGKVKFRQTERFPKALETQTSLLEPEKKVRRKNSF